MLTLILGQLITKTFLEKLESVDPIHVSVHSPAIPIEARVKLQTQPTNLYLIGKLVDLIPT